MAWSIVVALYDGGLSAAVSFEPRATADADRVRRRVDVVPRLASGALPDDEPPLVVIATDGELYGHHQPFRDLFLAAAAPAPARTSTRGFDVVTPRRGVWREPAGEPFRTTRIVERTSWSCHHGVLRWSGECAVRGRTARWKGPLRAALERLAAGIDVGHRAGRGERWPARR